MVFPTRAAANFTNHLDSSPLYNFFPLVRIVTIHAQTRCAKTLCILNSHFSPRYTSHPPHHVVFQQARYINGLISRLCAYV